MSTESVNEQSPLIEAVLENDMDTVVSLVESDNIDVNAKNSRDETALMCAVVKGNTEVVKYLVEHEADINAQDVYGKTALMLACSVDNEDIYKYLVANGADLEAKDKEGMGIEKYYSGKLLREYREQQRNEYSGDAWKDILKHVTASTYGYMPRYVGYTTKGGDISVGVNQKIGGEVYQYPLRNAFDQMMTLVHEGNHRMHIILDGMEDGNFSVEQKVKLACCTEAVAHTSECLAAVLQYQRMKKAGIKTYQYQDSFGIRLDVPTEALLNRYPPELREYVTKNGFDPNNKKDVKAVTEIGLQFWEKRKKSYAKAGGEFDVMAKSQGMGEGVSKKEFDALIDRMCEGVVIGDGVELDLRKFAKEFNGMTDEEAQIHVSRANGHAAKESVENSKSERDALKEEIGEQIGELVDSGASEEQRRFENRLRGRNEGKGAVKPTKEQGKPLNLALLNANRGRG